MDNQLGFALLYVTHDRGEAYAIAGRIVVMAHGRAVLEGSPERVKRELKLGAASHG